MRPMREGTVRVGVVSAADAHVVPDGTWARFGDQLVVWSDDDAWARTIRPRLQERAGAVPAEHLHLVTRVGRTFQRERPEVPVLFDAGRYLVVALDPVQAHTLPEREELCYEVRPLTSGTVAFQTVAPQRRPPQPWVQELVSDVSRATYELVLTHLVSYPTRHSRSPEFAAAAQWARDELVRLGYAARLDTITISGSAPYLSLNVVADRAGSGAAPRNLLVLTAHLDSINLAGGPAAPAPGADDNGSGAAGLLESARVLAGQPAAHDLRLVLFGGEEEGLYGSRQYVAALPAVDRARITAVINMDMIGTRNTAARTVLLEGAAISQSLIDALAGAAATYSSLAVQTSLHPFNSDHVPFITAGLPAVLTIEGTDDANDHIHTDGDVLAYIDYDLALDIVRMNVATIAEALSPGE
jgi:Peptidase family M28